MSFELPGRDVIEGLAQRVYELLTARISHIPGEKPRQKERRVERSEAEYWEAAAELSQMVLGPAARLLGKKRLVIVTQGALQRVPFAALPVPVGHPQGQKLFAINGYIPLVADHEITSLPSASTLAALRCDLAGRRAAQLSVAILADPVFKRDDERILAILGGNKARGQDNYVPTWSQSTNREGGLNAATSDGSLPRLLTTRWEAEKIASLAPAGQSKLALDFAASVETVMSGKLARYRIVHFATHALINNEQPELSAIALSMFDETGRSREGLLRLRDIFSMKLPVELVVLSACRTGLGKQVRGEGTLGLTRGFMYAGAPRVVVSLWSLEDKATAEFMVRFYRNMLGQQKLSPASALRRVQIETMKDSRWRSPFFWAAFVLQGEWR
ncbi:MAG TPA: CHAT domain-containing protein [Blastocatellia bacterium]|nr:CHAT domain-containing protein [Blastocatellia bacterium]